MSAILNQIDWFAAKPGQRLAALRRAQNAVRMYGAEAQTYLKGKLSDPRRRGTRRELRIAVEIAGRLSSEEQRCRSHDI